MATIQYAEFRMKTATTKVAAASCPRIAVAAGLVPALIIFIPEVTAQYLVAIRRRLKATVAIQAARIQIQRKNHKGCKF